MYHHSSGLYVSHYEPQPLLRAGDAGRPGRSPVNLRRVFTGGATKSKLTRGEHSIYARGTSCYVLPSGHHSTRGELPVALCGGLPTLAPWVRDGVCGKPSTTACGTCRAALGAALHPFTEVRASTTQAAGLLHQLRPLCILDPLLSESRTNGVGKSSVNVLCTCLSKCHRSLSQVQVKVTAHLDLGRDNLKTINTTWRRCLTLLLCTTLGLPCHYQRLTHDKHFHGDWSTRSCCDVYIDVTTLASRTQTPAELRLTPTRPG